jgi:predicted nucleotidyltransferase
MPVRSLSSSVLKWPDAQAVEQALCHWTEQAVQSRADVLRIGYFGSYARGDWGVGSDLDVIIILESSQQPFEKRSVEWDTLELPVPADVLVYTQAEWESLSRERRFHQTLLRETVWVYARD